jgi:hypothetical protein
MRAETAWLRGLWPSVRRWMSRTRPPSTFADESARTRGRRTGDRVRGLNQGTEAASPTSGELWARVQAAEKEYEAAVARCEAFGVLDPSMESSPEYEEAYRSVSRAWVNADVARHELDAFFHPKRYAKKGYRDEALGEFRARAEADEPEVRREAHGGPAVTTPGTRIPPTEGNPGDRTQSSAGPGARREGPESARAETASFAPTPYQLGLTANGVSWEDLNMPEPTPFDPFGGSWAAPRFPDR